MGDVRSITARLKGRRAAQQWSKHTRLQLPDGRVALVDETTMEFLTSKAPPPTQASLDRTLTGMTRFRVTSAVKGGPRLDVTAAANLVELAASLRIAEPAERFRCICSGGQRVEIYGGSRRPAVLMLHHGVSLRWEGKWNSDAELADPRRIQRTLALMGFDEPLREAQGIARSRMQAQVALQRWRAAAPHGLEPFREVLENEQIIWLDALVAAHPTLAQAEHRLLETSLDQDHAIRALLRWYGSGTGTWGCFPAYEDSARAMLWRFSSEAIVRAIESTTLTDEELSGAARYVGEWHFQRLRAADATLVPAELRGQLLAHVAASQIDDNLARLQAAFGPSVRGS